MKLHITGIEEAIKKIKRLEEIVKEAEDILWYTPRSATCASR